MLSGCSCQHSSKYIRRTLLIETWPASYSTLREIGGDGSKHVASWDSICRLGESSMNTAQSFPDGYMGVEDTSITRSRALSRAESLGVYVDEHEGEKLVSTSAEERWAARLDNITVQPLVHVMEQPSRSSKVGLFYDNNALVVYVVDNLMSSSRWNQEAVPNSRSKNIFAKPTAPKLYAVVLDICGCC